MKRKYLLLPIFVILIFLTACKQPNMEHTGPLNTNSGTSSSKVQTCKKSHSFTDDSRLCTVCGADYYAETLEFKLADTRDSYILTGIGTCDRSIIIVPERYHDKPVLVIADGALSGRASSDSKGNRCRNITEIRLPASITKIGYMAFAMCDKLETINIPQNVKYIGAFAFVDCVSLRQIVIPDGITVVYSSTFAGCKSLNRVVLPKGLLEIGEGAFDGCEALRTITLPNALETIRAGAFQYCYSLLELEIPEKVTIIERGILYECRSLAHLELPGNLSALPESMLKSCTSLESLSIPLGITEIPSCFLDGCTSLKSVELPNTIVSIGEYAFRNCISLTELQLPDTLQNVGKDAFADCGATRIYEGMAYVGNSENHYMILIGKSEADRVDVVLHTDTKILADYSLYQDTVETFTVNAKLEIIGLMALQDIKGLNTIQVAPENSIYHSANNCLIETGTKTLLKGCRDSVIPDDGSVTVIANGAFGYATCLEHLTIPDSVMEIQSNAFKFCADLHTLVIGTGIRKVRNDVLIGSTKFAVIYYHGTQYQWNEVDIYGWNPGAGISMGGNKELRKATLYFYSETPPTEEGNYWRYVDGVPTPWEEEA